MIIDVHTHIFPEFVVREKEKYFDGEPAFKLLYSHPSSRMVTSKELLENMDREGIDCSVVFGFPWASQKLTMLHNDYVLEEASKYPGRLIPFCCVMPSSNWAIDEVRRCMDGGARGAGELAIYSHCNEGKVFEVFEEIATLMKEKKGILLVHANEPVGHNYPGKAPQGLDFYYQLMKICQGIPLILAHWGGGILFFKLLKKEVQPLFEKVYFDTAASPYLYVPFVYRIAIEILGIEKILFGSDFPLLSLKRYLKEMEDGGLSSFEKEKILGENAKELFFPASP